MCAEDCRGAQRVTAHKADGTEKTFSRAEKTNRNWSEQVQVIVRDADRKLRRQIAWVERSEEANQEAGETGVEIKPVSQQRVPQQYCEGGEQIERRGRDEEVEVNDDRAGSEPGACATREQVVAGRSGGEEQEDFRVSDVDSNVPDWRSKYTKDYV